MPAPTPATHTDLAFRCGACHSANPGPRASRPTLTSHYPEPALGTREEAVKALLKEGLRSPERARINSRQTSATGLALGDKFVSILDVLRLVACPLLSPRQVRIVDLYFGQDLTNDDIAGRLGMSRATVAREKRAAVSSIADRLWPYPVEEEAPAA